MTQLMTRYRRRYRYSLRVTPLGMMVALPVISILAVAGLILFAAFYIKP